MLPLCSVLVQEPIFTFASTIWSEEQKPAEIIWRTEYSFCSFPAIYWNRSNKWDCFPTVGMILAHFYSLRKAFYRLIRISIKTPVLAAVIRAVQAFCISIGVMAGLVCWYKRCKTYGWSLKEWKKTGFSRHCGFAQMLSAIIQTYLQFQWQDEPAFPKFPLVREVQTGCKLREGWSKVLDFTGKIGFC